MSKQIHLYTQTFKTTVLGQLKKGRTVPEVAAALGINVSTLYRWHYHAEKSSKKTTPTQESNASAQ